MLVVATTWTQGSTPGALDLAPEQRPVQLADEHFGDPATSSVRYEADIAVEKPLSDVIVNGAAYAPEGRPVSQLTVELAVGPIRKQVRVVGDRTRGVLGGSSAEPFVMMPIVYERAYGGVDGKKLWRRNPVGVGFGAARPASADIRTEYPNLEPVGGSRDQGPIGFGIISRAWSPRLEWAGTFDQQWLDSQWPLLPRDFDSRHYQAAPPDQQVAALRSGEVVTLTHLTPDGSWRFELPSTELSLWLIFDRGKREVQARMDTLLIEPDTRTVSMTFRLKVPSDRRTNRLREVVLGPVTPGLLRAIEKRKPYIMLRDMGRPAAQPGAVA